jgi:hypothetical protein
MWENSVVPSAVCEHESVRYRDCSTEWMEVDQLVRLLDS